MKPVRVWFSKTGAVKYISHLDLTRCMARALKLSKLPVWYTQGFNPHIYMTFAMPLSLGVSGERECLDIRISEDVDYSQAAEQLGSCLPKDISILEISEPVRGFDEIAYGEYEMFLESTEPQDLADIIKKLLSRDTVNVIKHGKKGDKEIDIKPHFADIRISPGTGGVDISMKLPCSLEGSVNPSLLLEALKAYEGMEPYAEIVRKRFLTKDFSDIR